MVDDNVDVMKYWTLLVRKNSVDDDIHNFEIRDFSFIDTKTSFAHSLEKYTIAFVGYTGVNCDLQYEKRGLREERIDPNNDLRYGDGVPRLRVSQLVGQKNISAASSEHFRIRVEGDLRTSIELRLEDTRPFEVTDAIRDQNIDVDIQKLKNAQKSEISY